MKVKQLLIFISVMCAMNISAQVTMGALKPPHNAAVLDLSQVPSQKLGLLLPPVELEELNLFKPPLATDPDLAAIGMVVYNTKDDFGKNICPGVHVWDGNNWKRISTSSSATVLNPVRITTVGDGTTFCGGVTFKISRPCGWSDDEWNALTASYVKATLNSVSCSGIFTKNGDDYYYFIQATAANQKAKITVEGTIAGKTITPAFSTEITVSAPVPESCFTISGANCFDVNRRGGGAPANFTVSYPYTLGGNLGTGVSIKSVTWSYASSKTAINVFSAAPSDNITIGANKVDVTYLTDLLTDPTITSTGFTVTIIATVVTTGSSCGEAPYVVSRVVTIKDADCCSWVKDVDGNIYSAVRFGTAGCWMTENLAVTKYEKDGNRPLSKDNLPSSSGNDRYNPYYTTPQSASCGDVKARNSDCYGCGIGKPGLLYNWAAAVGAKSADEALSNKYVNYLYGTTIYSASNTNSKDEDICPAGWYLPSDAEWHALENEIHKNRNKYSSASGTGFGNVEIVTTVSTGTHGQYMRAVNDVPRSNGSTGLTYPGASNRKESGFNDLIVGGAGNGSWSSYGTFALYITSSGNTSDRYWDRQLPCVSEGVTRSSGYKYHLRSVRCKKLD
jgi:uncharacterized protein (TIGR02145 family)